MSLLAGPSDAIVGAIAGYASPSSISARSSTDSGDRHMPRIAYFYGVAIYMYYRDHAPPHFHAIYGDDEAIFEIETSEMTTIS